MMMKKTLTFLVILITLSVLMTACNQNKSIEPTVPPSKFDPTLPPSKDVALKLISEDIEAVVEEYGEENRINDIKINVIEPCKRLTDFAIKNNFNYVWTVTAGGWTACTGTDFCTDGKRPTVAFYVIIPGNSEYVIDKTGELCSYQ